MLDHDDLPATGAPAQREAGKEGEGAGHDEEEEGGHMFGQIQDG